MTKYDVVYNLDNLVALPDERRRVMDAIEEAQWQDEFEQDDQLSIESLHREGGLVCATFLVSVHTV